MKLIHDKHGKVRVDLDSSMLNAYDIALGEWILNLCTQREKYRQKMLPLPQRQEVINLEHPPASLEEWQERINKLTKRIEELQAEKASIQKVIEEVNDA